MTMYFIPVKNNPKFYYEIIIAWPVKRYFRIMRYNVYDSLDVSLFLFSSDSNDVICFCPSFAISMVVECSGTFKRSALSKKFELSPAYTSKFVVT